MKDIRLIKLELTNYRNIEHEVFVFGGKNSKIVGENRIGKTNTLEAIYFLFSNYLLDGSNDLTQLKPLDDTKKVVSVKGVFEIYDPQTPQVKPVEISLEKQYKENWVTKRGTTDRVLDGHSENYFVNDIAQSKAGEYYDVIEEYFGVRNDNKDEIDVIQMLCNPLYLGNLGDSKDWTDLRSFIIQLIGDVSNEEVFEAEPTTVIIKEDLEKALGKTEQIKKMYDNDIKGLTTSITGYDANINMLEKTPRPSDEELAVANKGVEDTQEKINQLMNSLDNNTVVEGIKQEVFAVKQEVLDLNTKEYSAWQASQNPNAVASDKAGELNKKLEEALDVATNAKFELGNVESEKRMADVHASSSQAQRDRLAKEYLDIKKEMDDVDSHIQTVCPTCNRPLDESTIEEARQNYLKGLQEKLDYVANEGKEVAKELAGYKEKSTSLVGVIAQKEKALEVANANVDAIKKEIAEARAEADAQAKVDFTPFVESDKLKALRVKLADLEAKLKQAEEDEAKARAETYTLIDKEKANLVSFNKVVNDYEYYKRQMETLAEVRKNKDEACKKLADVEQKKSCLQLFNYTKLRLLDAHVAHIFGNIKFQLIRENINGGFDPVCKPYIYDVEKGESTSTIWKSGSKSEKIVTGIAIIEAIKQQRGLPNIPVLFDEGGEVSSDTLYNRLKTSAQIICVKVEDNINKPVVVTF